MQQQQEGLTMGAACNLPGCDRPISAPNRLACGEFHHLLIMAQRYHNISTTTSAGTPHSDSPSTASSTLPDNPLLGSPPQDGLCALPQQAQLLLGFSQRPFEGLCTLPSCLKPPSPNHAWCSRRHYLEWLKAFYRSVVPDQICKLRPECTRHVWVDVDEHTGAFRAHPFCGWTHCQEYHKRVALRNIMPAPVPPPQLRTPDEGFYPCEPSEERLIKALIDYAASRILPKGIKVMEDFYTKHPWEVPRHTEDGCCFLITKCLYKDKEQKRELTTKDEYHWKQQGRPSKVGAEANKKYFRYRKLQGKKRNSSESSIDDSFTMVEYSIVEGEFYNKCKGYSLIKLSASQAQPAARKRRKEVQADEAESSTLPPDNAPTVEDQVSDYLWCEQDSRDINSLDPFNYPLQTLPFTEECSNTGVFNFPLPEGLGSSNTSVSFELEAMDGFISDSLSGFTN